MKKIKLFVLLLAMIAAGTTGFMECSKKDVATAPAQKEYDYTGVNYVGVLNNIKNYIAADVVYVNDSTLNAVKIMKK